MRNLRGEIVLFITAMIWGFAFAFQSSGADYVGAFTFNAFRFLLGAISLLPIMRFNRSGLDMRKCLKSGVILGSMIFMGSTLQQIALIDTPSGKAGFISSLYMIFTPILGYIIFKTHTDKKVILALILGVCGMYLINGASFEFELSDILLVISSLFFALHIIFVDKFAKDVNSVALSLIQYVTAGIIALVLSLIFESGDIMKIAPAIPAVLYTGILSTGVAYTLQIIGQKKTEPAIASLILSLESVVSVFGGFILLGETLSLVEIFGCILMFIGVLIAQRRNDGQRPKRVKRDLEQDR